MAGVNKVIIIGNLGADPEVHTFNNGNKIATISIATSERWTDRMTGEMREHTEWHRVVFNDRLADIVEQYLRKGNRVYVEGSLRTRKWQDQQGQDRYSTDIRANQMQMLDTRPTNTNHQRGYQGAYQNNVQQHSGQQNNPPHQNSYQAAPHHADGGGQRTSNNAQPNHAYNTPNPTANQTGNSNNAQAMPNNANNAFDTNKAVANKATPIPNDVSDDDMPF